MFEIKSHRKIYSVDTCTKNKIIDSLKDSIVIIDKNVLNAHQEFNMIGDIVEIVAKEENKTIDYALDVLKCLFKKYELKKTTKLVAVGGGITQDIVGFISSILFRGVDWIFIPTTLLAQSDSCIGGKTSLNFHYKNLLGTFYPPSKILICEEFLSTLSKEDIKSGIGEILHFYIVDGDIKSSEELMANYDALLEDPMKLSEYARKSLQIKKKIIEIDEFDKGIRNIFNYGHTFGHAIESMTKYSVSHGRAVTLGMCIANYVSYKLELIDKAYYKRLKKILSVDLPIIENFNFKVYMKVLSKDKKNVDSGIMCILLTAEGPKITRVENNAAFEEMIKNALKDL